jgi:L-cysteine:1D-myo-inositol 2-amino-2-deoxy-alpha-D-glucopyranoside ligase
MHTWPAPHVPVIPGHGGALRLHVPVLDQSMSTAGPATATIAVCGITPSGGTHLGHVATYVTFDLVVRAWLDAGLSVTSVQHVADIDEALLAAAAGTRAHWSEIAHEELATFALDMTALGVIPPTHYLSVADALPATVSAIEQLLADGAAYRVPVPEGAGGERPDLGDVYADLAVDPRFGSLSGLPAEDLARLVGERGGDPGRPGKRDPRDPLLWRRERAGEPSLDGGTLGTGWPGRHIVCAAAVREYLGGGCDVLGGGGDLLAHHETTASHLRVLGGHDRPIQRLVEASLVTVDGVAMGAGGGTPVLVAELLGQGVAPAAIRLLVLAHHYRQSWEYDPAELELAAARQARWTAAVSGNGGPATDAMVREVRAALTDDLDAPRALAAVDAWAEVALSYGQPGGIEDRDVVEGAPGVAARAVDALLGVRL